jgi:hypothetical protein
MSVPGIGPIISSAMVAAIRSGGGRSRLEAARLNVMDSLDLSAAGSLFNANTEVRDRF